MPRFISVEQITCHALGHARSTVGAGWVKFGLSAPAATVPLVQIDGGGAAFTAANLRRATGITVLNASSTDSVFATSKDPGAGTSDLGIEVPPGKSVELPLFGTGTPPVCWVYGAAGTPRVQVAMALVEVQ